MSQPDVTTPVDELKKAIAAHGMWKVRLRQAIESGSSEFTVAGVQVDDRCDFGKWIYGLDPSRQNDRYRQVKDLHASFHRAAADVLGKALAGNRAEAEELMTLNGNFGQCSSELTRAMQAWVADR